MLQIAALVAAVPLLALAALVTWVECRYLLSLVSESPWYRLWVGLPGIGLAGFTFALTIAGAGAVGIPLAFAIGILAFEVWVGLCWYHSWVGRFSLRGARHILRSNPELKTGLKRSRLGRFLVRMSGREGQPSSERRDGTNEGPRTGSKE